MDTVDQEKPRDFVFLLVPQFSMMAFAAAIEPLRQANRMSRKVLYSWQVASADGKPVLCSNGCMLSADIGLDDVERGTSILVCAGLEVREGATKPVLS